MIFFITTTDSGSIVDFKNTDGLTNEEAGDIGAITKFKKGSNGQSILLGPIKNCTQS